MTVTIDCSQKDVQKDLETYARAHYCNEENKQQWKSGQAALTIICFFVYFFTLKFLPTITALILIAGATLLTCLFIGCYFPIYVRRKVADYVKDNARNPLYTITLASEGIRYTKKGDSTTYSWSSLRGVEDRPDGYVELNLLDSPWHIPPSSFIDKQHRALFLKALESGRRGEVSNSWWTQDDTLINQS